jgi:hypothetical protein
MTSPDALPTSYAAFFESVFGSVGGEADADAVFEAAATVGAVDRCEVCEVPVVNITAFVEGIGEHYLLDDAQFERLEAALTASGVEVSDEGLCSEHSDE